MWAVLHTHCTLFTQLHIHERDVKLMLQATLTRTADGKFAPPVLIDISLEEKGEDLKNQGFIPRSEAAQRLKRSPRQLSYYHKLLALHSEPYKLLLARKMGRSQPKYQKPKEKRKRGEKANGLLYLIFRGKPIKGWIVDLKKPLREPQITVLRRVRDQFASRKSEEEVIGWIKRNEATITQDLEELINEVRNEFESISA
jgi:hypothetical protein